MLGSFGILEPESYTDFQEDCAGCGQLTAAVRVFGLVCQRRDAAWAWDSLGHLLKPRLNMTAA